MLPVGADSPHKKRSGCHSPSCISLGGPEQKVPSCWHKDAQGYKEAELSYAPTCKVLFPMAVLSQGRALQFITLKEHVKLGEGDAGAKQRQ